MRTFVYEGVHVRSDNPELKGNDDMADPLDFPFTPKLKNV